MPNVTFILPAYKRRFLKETIASILAQTHRDFELVVVDDCSPQNLKEIVDQFNDSRLSYHRNAENIGGKDLVAAWTSAMQYCKTEWCILASDDDVYFPDYLEEMVRLRDKYPQCDLFHSRLAMLNDQGQWTDVSVERIEFESQLQMVFTRCVKGAIQTMAEFMFRTRAWHESGGFISFPRAWHSDTASWIALAKNGCVCSPEVLYGWRSSGENISSRFDDLLEKQDASAKFKDWLSNLLRTIDPVSDEERNMKPLLLRKSIAHVDTLSRWEMGQISLIPWLRIMTRTKVASSLKTLFLRDRLCRPYKKDRVA